MLIGYNKLLTGGGDVIFQTKTKGEKKLTQKLSEFLWILIFFMVHFM